MMPYRFFTPIAAACGAFLLIGSGCKKPTAASATTTDPVAPAPALPSTPDTIRQEALKNVSDPSGQPLPLVAIWNTGTFYFTWPNRPRGSDPEWQLDEIDKGRRLLPGISMPTPDTDIEKFTPYYFPAFERLNEQKLPFVLLASQWERGLTAQERYFTLPPAENPNVVTPEGEILKRVDAFGPTALWYEIGKSLTDHPLMDRLQEVYPDPPRLFFLSNNEHSKLRWHEVEQSRRYLELHGKDRSDEYKKRVLGEAWIEKYRALQQGMRDGLKSETWKKNARFIAYGGDVSIGAMGRWGGWTRYSLMVPGRISTSPHMWDGVSPSYYMNNWSSESDHTVMSTQIQAMNTLFALQDAYRINPGFWSELSLWDGDAENEKKGIKSRLRAYREAGQVYDMPRHLGWVQYGLWLLQPRALRLYGGGWTKPVEEFTPQLDNLSLAVDRVHENETLRRYWQQGRLLPNPTADHPYQSNLPKEMDAHSRWYLLNATTTPPRPWKLTTDIPVFSLAYELGEAPKRSWLIYAHAPLSEQPSVGLEIPGGPTVTVDVPREGAFYEISEDQPAPRRIEL